MQINYTHITNEVMPDQEVENLFVMSGGGARFPWAIETAYGLIQAGYKPAMFGSTSTGTIASFMLSKGLFKQAQQLCDLQYSTNAKGITKSGIGKIKDGKIKVDYLRAIKDVIFNRNDIVSLMDNQPLIDTLTAIDNEYPGFPIPILYNGIDMITGKLIEWSTLEEPQGIDRIHSLVASTTIPGVWPLINGRYGDGGIREGTPLSAMFGRVSKGTKKRIIVISCNRTEMADYDQLSRIDKIVGRTASISMNETQINDLGRTQDRNEVAKAILDFEDQLPQAFKDRLPYSYAPISIIEYKGNAGTFEFTPESLKSQRETAKQDVANFLAAMKQ